MDDVIKKVMRTIIIVALLSFCAGFICGYLFNRIRSTGYQAGASADVSGYDTAAERAERAARAVAETAGNVAEAAGELRIGIDEVGSISGIAGDIGEGTDRALDGVGGLADGVQRIMGIMDGAEKRSAEMEAVSYRRMD